MLHNPNILGWKIEESEDVDLNTDPNDLLVVGITNKDIKKVETAISLGANLKKLIGKEKLSSFALRNFNEDVCNLLIKNGVSFNDTNVCFQACLDNDNKEALIWLLAQKHYIQKLESNNEKSGLVLATVMAGASDCLNYLSSKGEPYKTAISNIQENRKASFFEKCWKEMRASGIEMFFENGLFSKNAKFTLERFLANKDVSPISMSHCKFLQDIITKNIEREKLWNSLFPINEGNLYVSYYSNSVSNLEEYLGYSQDEKLFENKKTNYGYNSRTYAAPEIYSFIELLTIRSAPILEEISKSSSGKTVLANIFKKDIKFLLCFLNGASNSLMTNVAINLKDEFIDWKDDKGNNLAHFILAFGTQSKSFSQQIYQKFHELFLLENNSGISPLSLVPDNIKPTLQKKMITKELKTDGLIKKSKPGKKAKM